MRVLLDEDLPRRLGSLLQGHEVSTVQRSGWAGVQVNASLPERRIVGVRASTNCISASDETPAWLGCRIGIHQGVTMSSSFQLVGVDHEPFQWLFNLSDEQLAEVSAKRCIADESPGYPCRISLEDARLGEVLLLLPYLHQPATSPFRSLGPIFVRQGVQQQRLPVGFVPTYVSSRLMSMRAYDAAHMMVDASVCEGTAAASEITRHFGRDDVAYIQLHNAKQGCFSCQAIRA